MENQIWQILRYLLQVSSWQLNVTSYDLYIDIQKILHAFREKFLIASLSTNFRILMVSIHKSLWALINIGYCFQWEKFWTLITSFKFSYLKVPVNFYGSFTVVSASKSLSFSWHKAIQVSWLNKLKLHTKINLFKSFLIYRLHLDRWRGFSKSKIKILKLTLIQRKRVLTLLESRDPLSDKPRGSSSPFLPVHSILENGQTLIYHFLLLSPYCYWESKSLTFNNHVYKTWNRKTTDLETSEARQLKGL